ncbi:MAG: phosphatase PAP2 family protein [Solirubrobacteraceae bacterium]
MRQRAHKAAFAAIVALGLLVAVNYAAFHLVRVERIDASLFNGFSGLRAKPHVTGLAHRIASLCNPVPYVYLCLIPVGIALFRRRPWLAGLIVLILVGSGATTELLKAHLHQPRDPALIHVAYLRTGTWPSGHATAAMALALCLVLAVPPRLRPWAAVAGAGFAAAVSYSFLALGWHYPSDAVGGLLVAATWTFIGVLLRSALQERKWRRDRPPGDGGLPTPLVGRELFLDLAPIAIGLLLAFAAAAALVLVYHQQVAVYTQGHRHLFAWIIAFGLLALALSSALVLVLRQRVGGPDSGHLEAHRYRPGSHSGSSPALAPRLRMNSRSESRLR